MSAEVPEDVRSTLMQLSTEAAERARDGNREPVLRILGTIETVAQNKLPVGDLQDRLLHGCAAVRQVAGHEPLVAAEYLDSMAAILATSNE
ncbi:hypothetical protein [Halalkalirubrum salinum]|uniref:hypothetical protein n=1 Tax=Halalkalirubrum salinum TaxID=2563889 RepID=UPI0010FB84A5|nr:hypothetical protein [Halalkalirubrum salinum]